MDILIGLGNVGYKIAKAFSKHPQYKTITIDHEQAATICVPKQDHPEKYEQNFPDISIANCSLSPSILLRMALRSYLPRLGVRIPIHHMLGVTG